MSASDDISRPPESMTSPTSPSSQSSRLPQSSQRSETSQSSRAAPSWTTHGPKNAPVMGRMEPRGDDFSSRRSHLATLSERELEDRFWRLADRVTEPLVALAQTHTTPSIERSVLLRMGFSSIEAASLVSAAIDHDVIGKGVGHLVVRAARLRNTDIRRAGLLLMDGDGWEETIASCSAPGVPAPANHSSDAASVHAPHDPSRAELPKPLTADAKIDVEAILENLASYRPRRRGWTWRRPASTTMTPTAAAPTEAAPTETAPTEAAPEVRATPPGIVDHHPAGDHHWADDHDADDERGRNDGHRLGAFSYHETSQPLTHGVPLPAAAAFGDIDPQPLSVITTEIASGRFEDDIRRMRMAAWHGADHLMVIRTAGQSHMDGLLEGTPQGVGGIPITRKQLRAQRKALDLIEDEVGRPINYHSYVSGVAGPEIAVLFAEEGVNGAHQDPQYNVLYRNVNMVRSFVDAAEAKRVMSWAGMAQIDGAHNANATAREAWKVMPELMVQHAINARFSEKVGMPRESICLSTVPPTAPPAPAMRMDLPYAVALRELFRDYKMRAQQNTKYMTSSAREATVTHTLNLMISALTRAEIQSTITPDEGRNVPWHIYNIEGTDTAKQALVGMDGLTEMVAVRRDEGPLPEQIRELKERAVLYMEEIVELGGYFNAVAAGMFVDSGKYPERNGDAIVREVDGGVAAGSVYERDEDYLAPVTAHFGYNNTAPWGRRAEIDPASLIGGCTLEHPEKIVFIDELDPTDNVHERMARTAELRHTSQIKPEMEWQGDGVVLLTLFFPTDARTAKAAALETGRRMGLEEVEVIHGEVMHPAEGTRIELKGRVPFSIDAAALEIPPEPRVLSDEELHNHFKDRPMTIVAATVGEDEHSVGLREIIDIKHGGIEGYGVRCHYLGTSVSPAKLVDAAIETASEAILISTIISHDEIHYRNMQRVHDLCVEKGVRDRLVLLAGGTQVDHDAAVRRGMDAGFGRGTTGAHVATFLADHRKGRIEP